jgi:hypothetical protein
MASTINTSIVKLRTSFNSCLPFKAKDHENKPYVGISRMRRFRMVYMCKGKRKYDYEAPMTSSLRIAHGWKRSESFVFQQRDILPCTFIFFFHLIHPSHIFLATPLLFSSFSITLFHSLIHIYLLYFFTYSIHIFFSLFFPLLTSFYLFFKALNSSLSCIHTI